MNNSNVFLQNIFFEKLSHCEFFSIPCQLQNYYYFFFKFAETAIIEFVSLNVCIIFLLSIWLSFWTSCPLSAQSVLQTLFSHDCLQSRVGHLFCAAQRMLLVWCAMYQIATYLTHVCYADKSTEASESHIMDGSIPKQLQLHRTLHD